MKEGSGSVIKMDWEGGCVKDLGPAARQFVEELFVESLVGFFGAH